jgi:thioredoxin-related protein
MASENILLDSAGGRGMVHCAMNKTSHIVRAGLLALVTLATASAGGDGWTSDFEAAKKQASSEKKDLLLDFTGSDWCGWCIKLNKEVFQEAAFKSGVKDKLVLVELDFPKDDTKLSEQTKAQNAKLRTDFKINGYPSIVLCDASGKAYAKTGYQPGGPAKYVTHLNELMAVRAKRDAAFAASQQASDNVEKAKQLVAGLQAMDAEIVDTQYADVVAKIGELDKDDSSGFVKARKEAAAKETAAAEAGKAVQTFVQSKVTPLMQAKEFDKAYAEVEGFIKATPTLPEDIKVGLTLNIGLARFVEKGEQEAANKFVDEVLAMFPNHEVAKHGDQIKAQVKAQLEQRKAGADKPAKPE